jgi:hypothetical protein
MLKAHTPSWKSRKLIQIQGYGKDTVRPVTIKQILDAQQPHPDADFKVDGDPISQVCETSLSEG